MYYQQLNNFDYTYVDNSGVASTMHYDGENNFTWNARIMANLILPKNFSAQVTGNYNAKQLIAQGERRPNYSLDAGIRKSFFSRKFSIALWIRGGGRIFRGEIISIKRAIPVGADVA